MASKAEWTVELTPLAAEDFDGLDGSVRQIVFKHLNKLKSDPLHRGEYLRSPLTNYKKDYVLNKKYRIVFEIDEAANKVIIWAIGRRDKSAVYEQMTKRLQSNLKKK